jgi:hypothetical protein
MKLRSHRREKKEKEKVLMKQPQRPQWKRESAFRH